MGRATAEAALHLAPAKRRAESACQILGISPSGKKGGKQMSDFAGAALEPRDSGAHLALVDTAEAAP